MIYNVGKCNSFEFKGCSPHLRGPVETGDDAMFGPVFVIEEPTERETGATTQISGGRQ